MVYCAALHRLEGEVPDTYASFAAPTGFLGVVVVAEPNFEKAIAHINFLGLNPGGSCLCFHVPPDAYPRDQLLSKADLNAHSRAKGWGGNVRMLSELEDSDLDLVDRHSREFKKPEVERMGVS